MPIPYCKQLSDTVGIGYSTIAEHTSVIIMFSVHKTTGGVLSLTVISNEMVSELIIPLPCMSLAEMITVVVPIG